MVPHAILLSGLGLDNRKQNFVRIETNLHARIKEHYREKRYPSSVKHLSTYLVTIELEPFSIGKEKLAKQIRVGPALKQGRRKRVSGYIEEAIQVALFLGIITSYEETKEQCIFHLTLREDEERPR